MYILYTSNCRVRLRLGLYKRSDSKKSSQELDSVKLVKHPDFKPDPYFEFDIGLIKLSAHYKKHGK